MSLIDEVVAIEVLSNTRKAEVVTVTNQNIHKIVFHPSKQYIYVMRNGTWHKLKYEVVK